LCKPEFTYGPVCVSYTVYSISIHTHTHTHPVPFTVINNHKKEINIDNNKKFYLNDNNSS
jgi:hypothetical protein